MPRTRKPINSPNLGSTVALAVLITGLAVSGAAVAANTIEVKFQVPVRARLDLTNVETVTLAPFLVVAQEGEMPVERRGVNVQEEFEGYLKRILRRRTQLKFVAAGPVEYPTYDFADLSRNRDFWRVVGERTGADLILAGSLDFDIQDRSGYRTEPYQSPYDGRTYYRQVLVEQTGFEYDIVMEVYDGKSGERIYSDNFKDFKQFAGESVDPLTGMFENLQALEDRIAGVFSQKRVETTRLLFTN